jgi:hypothetical protein
MRRSILALAALLPLAAAAQSCPWMNSATASELLGDPLQSSTTEQSCRFISNSSKAHRQIRIEVGSRERMRCSGPKTAISGLGNEALACESKKRGIIAERVWGRVRNRYFAVEVLASTKGASAGDLLDIAKRVAAQVAGNLF